MKIECGFDGDRLDEKKIFVCHHCGMPICEEHGWVVASDDAFASSAEARSALPEAVSRPGAVVPTPPPSVNPTAPVPRAATTVPLPAMHCRDCVERFHKGANKRHGWIDQRAAAGRP